MHTAKVQEIIAAAMEATKKGEKHVSFEYFAKGDVLSVSIRDKDYEYSFSAFEPNSDKVQNLEAHLWMRDAGDQLDAILEKIKGL